MKINVSSTKDLNKLFAELQRRVNVTQTTDVAPTVREEMKDQIEQVVYSVYDPKEYERQMDDGGLIDDENIDTYMTDATTLVVESNRFDGDKNVGEVVVTGQGYSFPFAYNGVARDYIEATKDSLEATNAHVAALAMGLKKTGLQIK
ncbi:hypothetical protein [Paenibacillus sp. Marseille-Q4541]|uniref:hypothetical protein n=1 Tax=Paenibacillus sp. Marseille-Q4541 TaxID=2831522 RepID=UPI001BA66249|nr:hypothetical protein [Paenibacillus sp. Marseille-Q4541]